MIHGALVPIILASDQGQGFWPMSRRQRPKQFLKLLSDRRSLLRSTADRVVPLVGGWERVWAVAPLGLLEGLGEHLAPLPAENLLVEPEGRGSAAAVAWATLETIQRYGPDVTVAVFPADHWVGDERAFRSAVRAAATLASQKAALVALGVEPTRPATDHRYLEAGPAVGSFGGQTAFRVSRLTEKPDLNAAQAYLAAGRYTWNSGVLVFRAGVMREELRRLAPEMLEPLEVWGRSAYPDLPRLSLEQALLGRTDRAYVIPARFGWDDLGDWGDLERLIRSDGSSPQPGHHIGLDSPGTVLYATDGDELIVTLGVPDVAVVRDGPVTLIVHKERGHEIRRVLEALRERPELAGLL